MGGTPASSAPVARRPRDPRLDFFRGLALFIILYDHILFAAEVSIPGFLEITPIFWGFTGAMAIFVFISGQVYGVAYGRVFDRDGFGAAAKKSAVRVLQLWGVHVASFVSLWIVMHAEIRLHLVEYGDNQIIQNLQRVESLHGKLGVFAAFLRHGIDFYMVDVLPMYMVVVALGPVFLWGLARRPWLTTAASLALYVVAQFGVAPPWSRLGMADWFFNPIAWQFVFFLGIALQRLPFRVRVPRIGLVVAAVVVIGVAATHWLAPKLAAWGLLDPRFIWNPPASWADRHNLHYARLIYFLVLAALAAAVLPKGEWFWNLRLVRITVVMGRHSLLIYWFGVVTSAIAATVCSGLQLGWQGALTGIVLATVLSAVLAHWAERRKRRRREAVALDVPQPQSIAS